MHSLVKDAFLSCFRRTVMQYDYQHHEAGFVGSVAFYYREVLLQAAAEVGVHVDTIIQSPMEGLITYHTN
jgi:hypothetical protein